MRVSLGVLLAFALAGLQLLAVLLVVFSSYLTSERALLKHARDLLSDVGTNTIEHSKGFLSPAQGAAELAARLAQNRVVASDDQSLLERFLFQQLQIAPQFAGVYYGGEDGNFVMVMRDETGPAPFRSKVIRLRDGRRDVQLIWRDDTFREVARTPDPADPYDARDRTWYERARAERATIWTDPYIFFSSQQPGITLAAPVLGDEGGVRGVVGVDIEISRISDFLSRLQIGETGRALIIHRNGDVIAHPDLALIKTENADGTLRFANIAEFEDPIARSAFAPLMQDHALDVRRNTASEFDYEGARYVSMVMPMVSDILPWTIAVYAPEEDFTAVIKQNRMVNLWIAVCVAAMTGFIGLALANYISRPVRAFAVRSALIAQGEIEPAAPPPKTYKELERANEMLVQQIVARRETESEYGQTFDMSARAMAQIDPKDGTVIRANAKFGEIAGAPAEMTVGKGLSAVAHPEDLLAFQAIHGTPPGAADNAVNETMRWIRRDGSLIWVRLNAMTIRDQKGVPIHVVLTVDDITQEKAQEGKIAQLNRDISHLARGTTMGQMAAGLAHELNQPLTAIAHNADSALLMLSRVQAQPGCASDPAAADLRVTLTEIERQSLRAGEIIRALRGFIRKDEGSRSRFDFAELLEQTLGLVRAEAVEGRVMLRTEIGRLPMVEANRVQIAQVIVNLLRNAIEAIAATDSDVLPESAFQGSWHGDPSRMVRVSASVIPRDEGDLVQVRVEDSGPGVHPSVALFTQFETSKPDGMGLGLSLCRSLVESNGGKLWHETEDLSPDLGGACFCFTLETVKSA